MAYKLEGKDSYMEENLFAKTGGEPTDRLILTKRLDVGIICAADEKGTISPEAEEQTLETMTMQNEAALDICKKYEVHAVADVMESGFLGHVHEMMDGQTSCRIFSDQMPVIEEALDDAQAGTYTRQAEINREQIRPFVSFERVGSDMEEVLFDPQLWGGMLIAVKDNQTGELLGDLQRAGYPAEVVGEIIPRENTEIYVQG